MRAEGGGGQGRDLPSRWGKEGGRGRREPGNGSEARRGPTEKARREGDTACPWDSDGGSGKNRLAGRQVRSGRRGGKGRGRGDRWWSSGFPGSWFPLFLWLGFTAWVVAQPRN